MENLDVLYLHPPASLTDGNYAFIPNGLISVLNEIKRAGLNLRGINISLKRLIRNLTLNEKIEPTDL